MRAGDSRKSRSGFTLLELVIVVARAAITYHLRA